MRENHMMCWDSARPEALTFLLWTNTFVAAWTIMSIIVPWSLEALLSGHGGIFYLRL